MNLVRCDKCRDEIEAKGFQWTKLYAGIPGAMDKARDSSPIAKLEEKIRRDLCERCLFKLHSWLEDPV